MTTHPARAWLRSFQQAVEARDFTAGAELFHRDATGYGTRCEVACGLDALITDQWTPVWLATTGFRFTAVDAMHESEGAFIVAARWESLSLTGASRRGRSTLLLTGEPLRCLHSHFSLVPEDGGRL
jgi:hypothetical protein